MAWPWSYVSAYLLGIVWIYPVLADPRPALFSGSFARELQPIKAVAPAGQTLKVDGWKFHGADPGVAASKLEGQTAVPTDTFALIPEPGFWEANRSRTLLVLGLILGQSGLIAGLLISRRRQRELETMASLVAELSTHFVNLRAEEVDQAIELAQRRVCECLGVEASGLWQWTSTQPREMILTHLFTPADGPKRPERLSAQESFPWLLKQSLQGKTVIINTKDIPLTAARDLETRRHYGVKTSVLLPLAFGGQPIIGVLTFSALRKDRSWSKKIVVQLELIAQLFTNALARKVTEQALRESELRLGMAADSAEVGLWELNCRTGLFWATERALSLFGFAATEVVSLKRFETLIHADDRARIRQAVDRALHQGEWIDVEYRVLLPDGRLKWIISRGRPYFHTSGEPERLLGVSADITVRKQLEQQWRLTIECMPNGVVLVTESGRIILVNAQAEQMFGYKRQELLGQAVEVLVPDRFRDRHPAHRANFAGHHQPRFMGMGRELFGRRKDGTEFPVELGLNPIRTEEGLMVLCAVVDISPRRRMEKETQDLRRQLAHTGRVSMLGQLASALAHELSQPLGAILRNAESAEAMLQEPSPDLEELRAIVTDIHKDDRRASDVIERLRSLLKRRTLDLKPVSVLELIQEVVSLVHADSVARHIKIESDAPAELPLILGDRVHLQQVLLNLILNAMDAMNGTAGSERCVTVLTRVVESAWVEIGVSDHGEGIAPEAAARLFEPFFTTKPDGMGMGLPVSRTIVEAHGGSIVAENRPEGGAIFRFRLPAESSRRKR